MIKSIIRNTFYLPTYFHSHNELTKKVDETFVEACRHLPHYGAADLKEKVREIPMQKALEYFLKADEIKSPSEFFSLVQNYLNLLDEGELREFLDLPKEDAFLAHFASLKKELKNPLLSDRHKQLLYDIYNEITNLFNRALLIITSLANVTDGVLSSSYDQDPYSYGPKKSPELLSRNSARDILAKLSTVYLLPKILNKFYSKFVPYSALTTPLTFISTLFVLLLPGIYQRFLQKCPQTHSSLKNMSAEALQKKKKPIFPRENLQNAILDKLHTEKGVILVGDPGSGKTALVESLIWRLLAQSQNETLRNCQIFSCKANNLNSSLTHGDLFAQIDSFFGAYSDQLVLFIDEFHQLFAQPESNTLKFENANAPQKMLTFANDFPYIIGATTTKEYDEIIAPNQTEAFARRFHIIRVPAMEELELKSALIFFIKQSYSDLLFDEGTISYIVEKAKKYNSKTSPIDAAINLLKEAARKVTSVPFKEDEEELRTLELNKINIGATLTHSLSHDPELLQNHNEASRAYDVKKQALDEKKNCAEHLKHWDLAISNLHRNSFQLAEQNNMRAWLETRALFKFVQKFVDRKKAEFGIKSRVTNEIVDQVIASCQVSR